jgi:hypothetical protein
MTCAAIALPLPKANSAGRAIEDQQAALDEKLDRVRQRRIMR